MKLTVWQRLEIEITARAKGYDNDMIKDLILAIETEECSKEKALIMLDYLSGLGSIGEE